MKTLETERLLLRPFTKEDEEIHRVVFADPEVCHYYCRNTRPLEEVREWLIHRSWQARNDDLGFLAVVRKQDSALLGLIALQYYVDWYIVWEDDPKPRYNRVDVELSYALGRRYWGNGYITEAGKALIHYAFHHLKLSRIAYGVDPANTRSINVMKRLGFRLGKNLHPEWPGGTGVLSNDITTGV